MDVKRLRVCLIVSGLLAIAPLFVWAFAFVFSRIDRSWLEAPAAMRVTVPIALGAAAVAFALHGLWLQRSAVAHLDARLAQIEADPRPRVGVGSLVGAAAGAVTPGVAARAPSGPMMVVDGEPTGDEDDPTAASKAQAAAVAAAKKQGKKQAKRAQRKAKSAAKREVRGMFRNTF